MTPQEAIHFLKETIAGCHILRDRQLKAVCEVSINALEKQIPKKPIKKNPICYEKTKDGIEHFAYDYFCPDCNKQIKATEHHCHCGQALDWSDTK